MPRQTTEEIREKLGLNRSASRSRRFRLLALGAAAVAVFAVVGATWRHRTVGQGPRYETEAVTRADLRVSVSATGNLQGINTVEVGAEVTGRVLRVAVD